MIGDGVRVVPQAIPLRHAGDEALHVMREGQVRHAPLNTNPKRQACVAHVSRADTLRSHSRNLRGWRLVPDHLVFFFGATRRAAKGGVPGHAKAVAWRASGAWVVVSVEH
jgi:hypothetical protein